MGRGDRGFSREQVMLLSLVRIALNGDAGLSVVGFDASADEWNALYALSVRQGVIALVYDGIMRLPKEQRPARDMLLRWGVNVLGLEQRYETQATALRSLAELFEPQGIHIVLLKGMGLAADYPVPQHRECGDIDIYTSGGFDAVDRIMSDMGIEIDRHITKHSNFMFKGVMIENHAGLLETDESVANRAFEDYLLSIIGREPRGYVDIDGVRVDTGNALFSAIFTVCHAITHFQSWGIVVRHFCDWGTFLAAKKDLFDWEEFRSVMRNNGYLKLVDTFTYICAEYLGFGFAPDMFPEADERLARRVLADAFRYQDIPAIEDLSLTGKLKTKWAGLRRLVSSKWKYDTTSGREFYDKLGISFRIAVKSILGRK